MKIGLALGGGGVRSLAHISVMGALDDLGFRPSIIAGSSMGAIIRVSNSVEVLPWQAIFRF
jgi:NTE family protein